jgi:hypothetical protein
MKRIALLCLLVVIVLGTACAVSADSYLLLTVQDPDRSMRSDESQVFHFTGTVTNTSDHTIGHDWAYASRSIGFMIPWDPRTGFQLEQNNIRESWLWPTALEAGQSWTGELFTFSVSAGTAPGRYVANVHVDYDYSAAPTGEVMSTLAPWSITVVQAVPEPSSALLLISGIGGLGAVMWRRRK